MFIGHSKHALDPSTLRLSIPSKLREAVPPEELSQGFIAALGLDGCLALYTPAGWRAMTARRVNLGQFDVRTFQRILFGTAERVHCDVQGRVVLPQRLVELVGLGAEVIVSGADDRIELWPPKRWDDIQASQRLFYEQLAEAYFGGNAPADLPPGRPAPAEERLERSPADESGDNR